MTDTPEPPPARSIVRAVPGLRRHSRLRLGILVAWTVFNVLGVIVGVASLRAGIAVFYLITFVVGVSAAWVVAIGWERSQPRRSARKDVRAKHRNAMRDARERSQRAAAALREVEERKRAAAAEARLAEAAAAGTARRIARQARVAEAAEADAARRTAAAADAAQRSEAAATRRAQVEEAARIAAAAKAAQARTAEATRRSAAEAAAASFAEDAHRAELTVILTPEQGRLVAAAKLRDQLAAGQQPPVLDPGGVVLGDGEVLLARERAALWEFRGQAVQYRQGGALFFGSPLFLIGSLAASVAVSAAARSRARRAAAAHGGASIPELC